MSKIILHTLSIENPSNKKQKCKYQSKLIEIRNRLQDHTCASNSPFYFMFFDRKAPHRYLNRRHKLYKVITNHTLGAIDTPSAKLQQTLHDTQPTKHQIKTVFIQVTTQLLNDNLDIFMILETIKPIKHCISRFSKQFLSNVLIATEFQSGRKLAYILYRLCRDSPQAFRDFNALLRAYIIEQYRSNVKFHIEQCIFFTDLFLYGFYFTARGFLERIFVQTQSFIVDFIARMPPFSQWSPFLPKKYLFKLRSQCQNWINNLIKETKSQYQELLSLQSRIKEIMVQEKKHNNNEEKQKSQRESLDKQYIELYEKYELRRSKLDYIEKSQGLQQAKQLQQVIQQCQFFDPMFRLPPLLDSLYSSRSLPTLVIQRIKPSQKLSLYDDEAFLSQLRQCSKLQKSIDLATYFVANLSTQRNREQLIEFVIDYCHNDANLDLIIKVIAEINSIYPEIGQYLTKKAYKISNQVKMNKKYLNLICQSTKHHLIGSQIILSYLQKRLQSQHTEMSQHQIIRQTCMILELLGQGIYHQSLDTNIEINRLLKMIQQKIIEKKIGNEFLFYLKCVKNYLRKPHSLHNYIDTNELIIRDNETLTQLTQDYNLNQHYHFILKRIKSLLHPNNNKTEDTYNKKRVVNYILNSIENETNFIQTFLLASLVKDINHKEIKQQILQNTIQNIQVHMLNDIQQAIKWSRFLGELYNYEIINRRQLSTILQTKLLYSHEFSQMKTFQLLTKCIIECLNTSKFYIIQSEMTKQANQYIVNFLIKFKRSVLKYLETKENKGKFDNVIIQHEVEELLECFHPVLLNKLNSIHQIDLWLQKVKFSSPKDTLLSVNLYKLLNLYQEVDKSSQFDPTLQDKPKKYLYKKQQKNQTNKKTIYKQKNPPQSQPQIQTKQISYVLKNPLTSIQLFEKQIEQINENFRNEQNEEMTEQQKILIKEEKEHMEKSLKQMMGMTPQIELDEKFPELNQRNLKSFQKSPQASGTLCNMRKILKNPQGKKMKIIARKINIQNIEITQVKF